MRRAGASYQQTEQGRINHAFRQQRYLMYCVTIILSGWDLNANRSGKRSDSIIPVISKRGKADLRYALYHASLIASTKDKYFTSWFIEKLKGREKEKAIKIKIKMRVKLAAKFLIIVWTLMKKKEVFKSEYLKGNRQDRFC